MEGKEKEKIDGIVENEPQYKISEEVKPPKGDKKETVILISIWSVVAVLVVVCLFLLFRCDHVYGEWKVVSPATCVSDGLAERYCLNDCGKSETKAIGNGAHSYSSPKVVEKATCTSEGRSESTCTICKDVKTTAIAKETHTYGQWFVSVESTCTADGEKKSVCVYCGDERVQSIEKTNHIFGGWNIVKEATCVNEGLKERKCTGCDLKESTSINLANHVYSDWRVTKAATCEEKGEQVRTCNICDDKIVESINIINHSYGAWILVENPGCVTNGLEKSYCTMCNKEKSRSISPTGHTDGEWIVDKNATCIEDGSKHQVCSKCSYILNREIVLATGHEYREKFPEMLCEGQKITYTCKKCNDSYTENLTPIKGDIIYLYWGYKENNYRYVQDVIQINGIEGGYGKYTVTITYIDPGNQSHDYSYQNVETVNDILYLGDSSWYEVFRNNSETKPKVTIVIEDEIGFKTTYIAQFPTPINDWFSYKDEINYYPEEIVIEVVTYNKCHAEDEWVVDRNATCTEDGRKHQVCSACNVTIQTEIIPMLGHDSTIFCSAEQVYDKYYSEWKCGRCNTIFVKEYEPLSATFSDKVVHFNYGIPYYSWNVNPSGGIGEYTMSYFVYEVWTGKVVLASGNIMSPTDPCIHLDTKDYSIYSRTLGVRVFIYDSVGTVTYDFILNNGNMGYFSEWVSTPYTIGVFIKNDANYV